MKWNAGIFVVVLLSAAVPAAWAGEQPAPGGWQKTADIGLNLTQSSYSNSWTGGEDGAVSWTLGANLLGERQFTPSVNWRNTIKLSFGQVHTQKTIRAEGSDTVEKQWLSPEKSSDRIFFESLLRLTLGGFVDPFASFTFESQFLDAGHPVVERFVHPIVMTESAGIGRTFVKNERVELYSRLGAAVRENLLREIVALTPGSDSEDDYETESRTTLDGGIESVTDFRRTFTDRLNYISRLRIFQAFFFSEADDLKGLPEEDYWRTADLAWENTVSASVTKYVQVSLFFELLYDKQIDLRGRFRETLGLGVTYKLF
ncbi:MAG: DUF3078 domain-containing protein [Candidatus Eisenbacteria bacterium]